MDTRPLSRQQGSGFQQLREAFAEPRPRKRAFPYDPTSEHTSANVRGQAAQHDHDYGPENGSNSSPKRSRVSDWPLKNTIDPNLNGQARSPTTRGKTALSREKDTKKKVKDRHSKFQEGSLNDKPSKQPPHAFLGVEDAMERYHADEKPDEQQDDGNPDSAVVDTRPTGTFRFGRFGKALANVFTGIWKEKQPPVLPAKTATKDDRKAKAEDAYTVLKLNDFKELQPSIVPSSNPTPSRRSVDEDIQREEASHDPAVNIGRSQRSSLQTIRTQNPTEKLEFLPKPGSKRSASPASGLPAGRRSSSLHLRTPSFSSLKKVKSQMHIPSAIRPVKEVPPLPTSQIQPLSRPVSQGLRRQTSKRDLAKHQRLSKKVSDLESKLDVARRELEKSLQTAPPVPDVPTHLDRKPFVPGNLASLPSERLLTPQTGTTPSGHSTTERSGSPLVLSARNGLSPLSQQLGHDLGKDVDTRDAFNNAGTEALVSDDSNARPDIDGVNYASWTTAQAAKQRRRTVRRSSDQQLSIDGEIATGVSKRQLSVSVSSMHDETLRAVEETPPPIPAISITTDEANKPRPATASLGRPGGISLVRRTRSKNEKSGISPPPPSVSPASRKRPRSIAAGDEDSSALTSSSAAGNRQKRKFSKGSPAPKATQMKAARARLVRVQVPSAKGVEKPLPEIQKRDENFQWGDDVF